MSASLGFLETHGLTPAMAAIDAMGKAAEVRVLQVELNDLCGVLVQIAGNLADVQEALRAGAEIAGAMAAQPVSHILRRIARSAQPGIGSRPEFNPLIQQNVVFTSAAPGSASLSDRASTSQTTPSSAMKPNPPSALGFIETQGFTAVLEALDTACKAADVAVIGKEKLGGGYVTVVIEGELSAVAAAVEAGRAKVEGLGRLIATHVIARPHEAVISLLPRL